MKVEGFVSGEYMARELGVSRAAIWKQINSLRELGYDIESVKNRGYHLKSRPDTPIPAEITARLKTEIIGRHIHYFSSTESTNTVARDHAKEGSEEGTIIIADMQTGGRGRKNRTWLSSEGGLWFSVILYPGLPFHQGMILTMASSVAVAKAIEEVTSLDTVIKWPNDLLLGNKKICGILTELDAEMDHINSAVVGIGINVNNTLDSSLDEIATTLAEASGEDLSRVDLLCSILTHLDDNYKQIKTGNHEDIRDAWLTRSGIIGKRIRVNDGKTSFTGEVSMVDASGYLVVETNDGTKQVMSGDIEYL